MKKFLGIFAAVVMMISSAAVTAAAADDGELYFYDFADYDVEMGQGIGVDSYWQALIPSRGNYVKSFGSFDLADGEHDRVLLAKKGGEPSFLFPEMLTTGKLRVSFDGRLTTDNLRMLVLFYNGRYDEPSTNSFGKPLFINSPARKTVSYYPNSVSWDKAILTEDYDALSWHHYDFISTELTGNTVTMSCYIDGELAYSDMSIKTANGIRSWGFRVELIDGTLETNDGFIVDNVYINHYSGSDDFQIARLNSDRVPTQNGRIRLAANERLANGISKNNVAVTNANSGKSVNNFSIENFTGQTFDIVFDGEIENGRYNISFKDVVGELSKAALANSVSFETEYKSEVINTEYEDIDFNDYTSTDGSLPNGFENIDSDADISAKSVSGKSGAANDFALGFSGMQADRKQKRAMYRFGSPIGENTEFDINFDMFVSNATQYFYLADKDDFSADNSDYKNNSLISVNQNGVLMYASGRSASPNTILDSDLRLASGEWHNINIKILPDLNNDKSYFVISVDGGSEYKVETSRDFHKNAVYGIGTGYLKTSSADADVRFDNLKISGARTVYYPEIDSIKAYDSFGGEVSLGDVSSAMISEVRAEFNTIISSNLDGFITLTEDGNEIPTSYEVVNDSESGRSTLVIRFDGFLNSLRDYKITIFKGIPSVYSDNITSFLEYTAEIKANSETGFKCRDFGYDESSKTAKVVFSKNNDASGTYIYVVAEYKTVTKNTDDGEKQTELLTGVRYVPINLSADDRGKFEYSLDLSNSKSDTTFKTYVWKYPKLEKLICADDGSVEE